MASSRDLDQQDTLRLRPVDFQESSSLPCSNNCGFFGSPRTNNLCSVCYNQSLPSSDALPSAVQPPPRQISLFDEFPPASTLVNRPPSAIQDPPIADTPALPSHSRWVFSVPPEDLVNGRVVFGGGGQSSSPWRFSRDPLCFSFGSGNVLPPSFTDPQVHQSPGSSPHSSFFPFLEPPISATASSAPLPEPSVSPPESSLTVAEPSPAPQASSLPVPEPSAGGSDSKKNSNRCHSCRKRLSIGLTFKCRCGDVFCSSHRFPDQHGCTLDIKAKEREAIAKDNPVIKADKLHGRI